MKTVLFSLLLLLCVSCTKAQHKKNSLKSDTVFISRSFKGGEYHAVFIEKDTNSHYYTWLTDFTLNENSNKELFILTDSTRQLQRFHNHNLPEKWCPLYLYKEKFYLYAPSDWGYDTKIIVTDSLLINFQMDGAYGHPFLGFKKVSANCYNWKLATFNRDSFDLKIHVIDTVNQIAIFEEKYPEEETHFYFMVSAEKAKNFPIIVNYSERSKRREFEFETPDISKYLKK